MSPLDMCFMASVVFALFKVAQLWVIWEFNKEDDTYEIEEPVENG